MKYLWVFLTACLVGIIYYNSSLPLKQSSEISSWFAALTQLLAQHLDIHLAGDVEHHIRKMAISANLRCWDCCCVAASVPGACLSLRQPVIFSF